MNTLDIFKNKSIRYWIIFYINISLLLGTMVLGLIIINHYNIRFDLTPNKKHSLPKETIHLLQSVEKNFKFTVFYKKGNREKYKHFLELLSLYSSNISFRLLNLDRNPGLAQLYNVSNYGQTILETKEQNILINAPFQNEKILKSIAQLTYPERQHKIYFTVGHGESEVLKKCKKLQKGLQLLNIRAETVNLSIASRIPAKGKVLIIAGPKRDLLPHEIDSIKSFMLSGGNIIFMLEPFTKLSNIIQYLQNYNIIYGNGIIVDNTNKLYNRDNLTPFIPYFAKIPITRDLRSPAIFPTASFFKIKNSNQSHVSTRYLAMSSSKSWSIADKQKIQAENYKYVPSSSEKGPLIVAVRASCSVGGNANKQNSQIFCFADADFIKDQFLGMYSNKDLFLNILNSVMPNEKIYNNFLPQKKYQFPFHHMRQNQAQWAFLVPVIFMPLCFLILGLLIYLYRRYYS